MSAHGHHQSGAPREPLELSPSAWGRGRNILLAVAVITWLLCAVGYGSDEKQFHASYLVGFLYFLTISLGAMFFVMVHHLTNSLWSVAVRRLMENIMFVTAPAALLFIPVILGLDTLYEWAHPGFFPDEPAYRFKAVFFSKSFYLARTVIYLAIWALLAVVLYRQSRQQDLCPQPCVVRRAIWWSGPGLLVLMVTVTMAAVDWVMSLDPHWYSTIFGVYVFSGGGLAFTAALILICLALRRAGWLRESITVEHYHDMGKWLFALTVFWAYIAFSQYMLIWYANIPEETLWYKHRLEGNWAYVSLTLLLGRFIIPFLVLLPRASKRNLPILGAAAALTLVMHFIDLHWLIMPAVHPHGFHLHWMDAAAFLGAGSFFALLFWCRLRGRPMLPVKDLRLVESLEHQNI